MWGSLPPALPPPLTPESTIKLLTFKKAFHALYPSKIEQTAAVQRERGTDIAVGEGDRFFYPPLSALSLFFLPWVVVVERDAGR